MVRPVVQSDGGPIHLPFLYSPYLSRAAPVCSPHTTSSLKFRHSTLRAPPYPTMACSLTALPATAYAPDASLCYAPRLRPVPLPPVETCHVGELSRLRPSIISEENALCRAPRIKTIPLPPVERTLELEFPVFVPVFEMNDPSNALYVQLAAEGNIAEC
jgi:hypothetical protein